MPAPTRAGDSIIAHRDAAAGHPRRRGWQFGASLLAITAALASSAQAQTVVGPGATVTNSTTTTGTFALIGDGGTLVNEGTISATGSVAVGAQILPFSDSDLTTYRIFDVSLINSGSLSGSNTNAVVGVSVNGFTLSNSGTIANSNAFASTGYPTVYLHNVNNWQLNNTGLFEINPGSASARLFTMYKVTDSTLTNQGTIAALSPTDSSDAVFISGDSNNLTINNSGTISTVGDARAVLIGNSGTAAITTSIDATHVFTVDPAATNITVNNSGRLSSPFVALSIGGTASIVAVTNSGTITTTAAKAASAITVQDAASRVSVANSGLIVNAGAGAAIGVSTSGGGVVISNTGTITELGGNQVAIDHSAGTTPLAISNSGIIDGIIQLSQPGDTLSITGGSINGAVTTFNRGGGTVTFNAPSGFTTGGDLGTTTDPLSGIVVAGGALNVNNALIAKTVTFGAGSTTTLMSTVNAVASNGNLNLAGGTLSLGTNALVLGANATVRTSTADGSTINLTIASGQNGMINARAGNATVDTSANTLMIRPNLSGVLPRPGAQYAVIATSAGANVSNALARLSVAPGPSAAMFSVGTATSSIDAFGNALTPGKDIVLIATGGGGAAINAAAAPSNAPIQRAQVNAIVSGVTARVSTAVENVIAGRIGAVQGPLGGISGGDEPGHDWTVWVDTSGNFLQDTAARSSYRGSIWTGLAGVDQPLSEDIIAGVVLGGEGNSFDLSSSGERRSGTGASISPYAAYILSDWASVDFEASYALLDNKVTVTAGQQIASHYVTNRVFAAGNLAGYWSIDALALRAKVGYLIANTGGPSYTDGSGVRTRPASTSLQQARLGGNATYHYDQFEPFLNLGVSQDLKGYGGLTSSFVGQPSASRFGLQYDAGLRYKTEGGSQVGFQVGGETLRSHQSSLMAGLFARIPL